MFLKQNISAFILVQPPQSLHKTNTRQALKQETALAMMMNVITSKAVFVEQCQDIETPEATLMSVVCEKKKTCYYDTAIHKQKRRTLCSK